jgi:hypothetical protein
MKLNFPTGTMLVFSKISAFLKFLKYSRRKIIGNWTIQGVAVINTDKIKMELSWEKLKSNPIPVVTIQ